VDRDGGCVYHRRETATLREARDIARLWSHGVAKDFIIEEMP
jgi:hypothetical protein